MNQNFISTLLLQIHKNRSSLFRCQRIFPDSWKSLVLPISIFVMLELHWHVIAFLVIRRQCLGPFFSRCPKFNVLKSRVHLWNHLMHPLPKAKRRACQNSSWLIGHYILKVEISSPNLSFRWSHFLQKIDNIVSICFDNTPLKKVHKSTFLVHM